MAALLNAAGEYIHRVQNLGGLGISGFSMGGWFYPQVQANNDAWFGLSNASNGRVITMKWHNDGPPPNLTINTNVSPGIAPANPPLNAWVFAFFTVGAGAGGAINGYWSALGSETWTQWTRAINDTEGSVQGEVVCVGRGRYTDPADDFIGGIAHFRAYDSVLNLAAIQALKMSSAPQSAWLHWPLDDETDTRDLSGNNRTPTIAAGIASMASPTLIPPLQLTAGPTISNATTTGFMVNGTANGNGTARVLVRPPGSAQPSNAEFDASPYSAAITSGVPFQIPVAG